MKFSFGFSLFNCLLGLFLALFFGVGIYVLWVSTGALVPQATPFEKVCLILAWFLTLTSINRSNR